MKTDENQYLESEFRPAVFPVDIFNVEGLIMSEQMVYIVLHSYCNAHTNTAFPKIVTIAKQARCSERTVIRAVKSLIERGLIGREFQFVLTEKKSIKQTSNKYILKSPSRVIQQEQQTKGLIGDMKSPPRVTSCHPMGDFMSPGGVTQSQTIINQSFNNQSKETINTHTHEAFAGIRETSATNERPEERTKTNEPNERVCKEIQSILEDKGIRVQIKTLQSWLQIADLEDIVYAAELATKDGVRSPAGFIGSLLRNGIIRIEKKDKRDLRDSRYEAFYRLFPNS